MTRRTVIVMAVWLGAGAAMVCLWMARDEQASLAPAQPAPGVPIRAEAGTRAAERRADLPVAPPEEGPPTTF